MKRKTVKKPTVMDQLVLDTAEEFVHCGTADIERFRSVMMAQLAAVEDQLLGLAASKASAVKERDRVEAKIMGLNMVINSR